MTNEELEFLLDKKNSEVYDAHKEIIDLQNNKDSRLIFGKEWLDESIIGGINNKILFFGSRPGNGKTHHCSETINALLDKNLNPSPVEVCRLNLEMPTMTLLLQQVSRTLNKPPKEILSRPYTEQEKPVVKNVVNSFMDKRIHNMSKILKGNDFQRFVEGYCKKIDLSDRELNKVKWEAVLEQAKNDNKDTSTLDKEIIVAKNSYVPYATKKVILIDHLMIYKSKEEIDDILLRCNEMKMNDKNLSFIIYFQLRRDVEDLWRDGKEKKVNPKNMLPNSTFIYLSDILQQIADIVVSLVIPQVYELEEYAAIHKERNIHLEKHFTEEGMADSNWTRLKARNRIYYNFMKIRLINSFDDPRLFCELLNPEKEEEIQEIYGKPTIKAPTFPPTKPQEEPRGLDIKFNTSVKDAFGDENNPF